MIAIRKNRGTRYQVEQQLSFEMRGQMKIQTIEMLNQTTVSRSVCSKKNKLGQVQTVQTVAHWTGELHS